jgi:hypothetical protein
MTVAMRCIGAPAISLFPFSSGHVYPVEESCQCDPYKWVRVRDNRGWLTLLNRYPDHYRHRYGARFEMTLNPV